MDQLRRGRALLRSLTYDSLALRQEWLPQGSKGRQVDEGIPEGGEVPDLSPALPLYAPNLDAEDIEEIAKRL